MTEIKPPPVLTAADITLDDATGGLPTLTLCPHDGTPIRVRITADACAMLGPILVGIGESGKATGWGHEHRPEYRTIPYPVRELPPVTPIDRAKVLYDDEPWEAALRAAPAGSILQNADTGVTYDVVSPGFDHCGQIRVRASEAGDTLCITPKPWLRVLATGPAPEPAPAPRRDHHLDWMGDPSDLSTCSVRAEAGTVLWYSDGITTISRLVLASDAWNAGMYSGLPLSSVSDRRRVIFWLAPPRAPAATAPEPAPPPAVRTPGAVPFVPFPPPLWELRTVAGETILLHPAGLWAHLTGDQVNVLHREPEAMRGVAEAILSARQAGTVGEVRVTIGWSQDAGGTMRWSATAATPWSLPAGE